MSKLNILTKGFFKENPSLILVLGTCPTLAVTTSVNNALGMGAATTFVLLMSNIIISALKNVIPDKVRIPCYIVIIATFVTIVQMVIKGFLPALDKALGLYIPLIVVNCIILGRAEMFANKNNALDSALDGLGMGLGYTCSLTLIGLVRELIGNGTIGSGFFLGSEALVAKMTLNIPFIHEHPMMVIALAPGGFFAYACAIACVNAVLKKNGKTPKDFSCQGCALAATCNQEKCAAELGELKIEKGAEA